jgi:hypothetical protein
MRERGKAPEQFFFHATAKHNKVVIVHSLLSFLSMYFFKSGGCPDLLMVSTPANSLQQNLETSDERHEWLEKLCKKRAREKERSGLYLFPPRFTFPSEIVKP